MLSGDNGLLTRAGDSKTRTERSQIIEDAKIEVLGKQTENLGSITENELETILKKYGTLSEEENSILDKTLTSTKGNYEIAVREIYDGNFKELGPGLYDENDNLKKSWQQLLDENILTESNGILQVANDKDALDGKLVMSNTVTSISDNALKDCSKLTNVVIPSSVTSIGKNAFETSGLKKASIKGNITNWGYGAFALCKNLEYAFFSNDLKKIGSGAFVGCENLKKLNFPDGLESIDNNAFIECMSLNEIILPESLINLGEMAFFKSGITNLTVLGNISDLSLSQFNYCPLKNIKLGSKNKTTGLKNITQSAFANFQTLENVIIEESVETIGTNAFGNCSILKNITLSEGLMEIKNNAFGCNSLEKITIPSSVTSIETVAFGSGLKTITLKNGTKKLEIKVAAFYNSTNLTDVYYTGTQDDWNALINIDNTSDANANFNNATKHFGQEAP